MHGDLHSRFSKRVCICAELIATKYLLARGRYNTMYHACHKGSQCDPEKIYSFVALRTASKEAQLISLISHEFVACKLGKMCSMVRRKFNEKRHFELNWTGK